MLRRKFSQILSSLVMHDGIQLVPVTQRLVIILLHESVLLLLVILPRRPRRSLLSETRRCVPLPLPLGCLVVRLLAGPVLLCWSQIHWGTRHRRCIRNLLFQTPSPFQHLVHPRGVLLFLFHLGIRPHSGTRNLLLQVLHPSLLPAPLRGLVV